MIERMVPKRKAISNPVESFVFAETSDPASTTWPLPPAWMATTVGLRNGHDAARPGAEEAQLIGDRIGRRTRDPHRRREEVAVRPPHPAGPPNEQIRSGRGVGAEGCGGRGE